MCFCVAHFLHIGSCSKTATGKVQFYHPGSSPYVDIPQNLPYPFQNMHREVNVGEVNVFFQGVVNVKEVNVIAPF